MLLGLAALFLALCAGLSKASSDSRPNIVLILADDLGYADIESYGHPYARTPNLNRLASEGAVFRQHYVTGATCAPSRFGLMTGVEPERQRTYPGTSGFQDRLTVTELLSRHGYTIGHFGKWGIGPKSSRIDGTYGIDHVDKTPLSPEDPEGRDAESVRAATRFIERHAGGPFYVNIWLYSTHFPVRPVPAYIGGFSGLQVDRADFSPQMQKKFDTCVAYGCDLNDSMRNYLSDVYSIDYNIGRILDTIDTLGLRERTLIVFSSDNGAAPINLKTPGVSGDIREYALNMMGYSGNLAGGKHSFGEGGIRVPFIVRWPGRIEAGRVDADSVTSFIDWLPTMGSLAGATNLPDDLAGEDITDIWLQGSRSRGTPLFWRNRREHADAAIRKGDWKLLLDRKKNTQPGLFNVSIDPGETTDLAQAYPGKVDELSAMLEEWVASLPTNYLKKHE